MFSKVEDIREYHKSQVESATLAAATVAKGMQRMVEESAAFSRAQYNLSAAAARTLFGAKSPTEALKIQADYAKSAGEAFVAQATKVGAIYADLANHAIASIGSANTAKSASAASGSSSN